MYSLTASETTLLDGGAAVDPPLGIVRCHEYMVFCTSGSTDDALVFIDGLTGTDSDEPTHWATIAKGTQVVFYNRDGISIVKAKASSSSATINAFPLGKAGP